MARNQQRSYPDLNPNKNKHAVDNKTPDEHIHFIKSVEFNNFRQFTNIKFDFKHPITVISGTNRSGKTTLLLTIACSHHEFNKKNPTNGNNERQTWSSVMRMTQFDEQNSDWTYHVSFKTGDKPHRKRGQRKHTTKKWNGIAKKESQIKDRQVVLCDLERILPPRYYPNALVNKSKSSSNLSVPENGELVNKCFSYIYETETKASLIAAHNSKEIYCFDSKDKYSSLNSASGEDVILRILIDCIEAREDSLILIDEVEIGLHPKIQRRLMDVIYYISLIHKKQFILTTHSHTILSSVPSVSRIFIDVKNEAKTIIPEIGINPALTKMDSTHYPLVEIFCEDELAKFIIKKAIEEISKRDGHSDISKLINIIESGSADKTYTNFSVQKRIYEHRIIKTGYACILDGDMANNPQYPEEELLHFLLGSKSPEKCIVKAYETRNNNESLSYHINNSENHCLFSKMVDLSLANDKEDARNKCFAAFIATEEGNRHFEDLMNFINMIIEKYASFH